jgi:two-component system, cell cycle sensor histidine kinase and response regulator CckA
MDPAARVLLVDDEPTLLRVVSAYLGRLGYSVTAANTTEKALAEMEAALADGNRRYDVAVLDASMNGMPMPELAARMLKSSDSLRVLTWSGYPIDIAPLEEMAPGRVAFLHKPFIPAKLAAALRRMLASQEDNV